jgi:exopolysaccharide production protein ExoQ
MTRSPRFVEPLVLGGCAFVLSRAILSLVLLPDGDSPADGSPVWRLILAVSYVSVAMLLIPCRREAAYLIRRNWFLAALVLLALVSFVWAEKPSLVLQRGVAVFGTTLFGVALAVRLSLQDQLRLMSWVLRIIAVLSLACVLFLPSYGISSGAEQHGEWQGIFSYKNGLGSAMALSALVEWYLPADTRASKVVNRLALTLSLVLLVFSASVTPLLALIGAVLLVKVYQLGVQRFRVPTYAIVLAILLIVASGAAVLAGEGERITSALGRSADLTGRTEIWSMVASYIPERAILGYGYSGFWGGASSESAAIDRAVGGTIMYSHNGYLEILLNLGSVGLFLTVGFLGTGIKRVYVCSKRGQSTAYLWPLAFLLFFLLYNLTECTILFQDLEWAACVATVIGSDAVLLGSNAEQELLFAQGETLA